MMLINVLRTESKADLDAIQAEVAQGIEPVDFIERAYVEDVVCHTWGIARFQRVATGILNNALRHALALILNEIILSPSSALIVKRWTSAQNLSNSWLVDPESKRQVSELLEEAGLDESAIEAKAYTLVADDLRKANQMLNSARDGRDKALRQIGKYRKSLAFQLRSNSDRALADQDPLIAGGKVN